VLVLVPISRDYERLSLSSEHKKHFKEYLQPLRLLNNVTLTIRIFCQLREPELVEYIKDVERLANEA
jgi:hypothetical protein